MRVEKGYCGLWTDVLTGGRADVQPKNIMPPAPKGQGIMKMRNSRFQSSCHCRHRFDNEIELMGHFGLAGLKEFNPFEMRK